MIAAAVFALSLRVIDGDTFVLGRERVRVENIDAPEIRGRCMAERDLAQLAKEALGRELGDGAGLMLDRRGVDRYGRTLARIDRGAGDIGQRLIAARLAVPWAGRRADWCGEP